jgi:4-amino-4-deoxy-L-arabinose transferase-like glycosyltransferase
LDSLRSIAARLGRQVPWLLLPILAIGAFLRIYGFRHGYPFSFHIDEWHILRDALDMYRRNSLRPPTFDYPSLLYYHHEAVSAVLGLFQPPTLSALHLAGRLSSAFWGTAAIAATYRLAHRIYGRTAGLLAAAFFALSVTALREAHFATVDTINVLFIILAMDAITCIVKRGERRDYVLAGILIGLVSATKYNGFLLLVPLILAHLMREMLAPVSYADLLRSIWTRRFCFFQKRLFAAAALTAVIFICTNPFAVLDAAHFSRFLAGKLFRMSSGIAPWNHHYLHTSPYLYYLQNLLYWSMGPVLELTGIGGILYMMIRRQKEGILVACWVVIYFMLVGAWFNKASRYTLPMLPFLALASAVLLAEMQDVCVRKGRRLLGWGWLMLGGGALIVSLLYSLAFLRIYSRPHTGIQALQWAVANIPRGSSVLLEPTAWERPPLDGGVPLVSDDLAIAGLNRFNFQYLDVLKFADARIPAPVLEELLHDTVGKVNYVALSMRWYEGFLRSDLVSPVLRKFYQDLFGGKGDFQKVAEFSSCPGLFGIDLNDDWAELNFRIFDHPKILIFKRREQK